MQSTFHKALTNTIKELFKNNGHKMDLYPAMLLVFLQHSCDTYSFRVQPRAIPYVHSIQRNVHMFPLLLFPYVRQLFSFSLD